VINKNLSSIWERCPLEYKERNCYVGNIFSWMFMGNLVHTSTVLLRRDCQTKVGFFDIELEKSGEDYDFHFRTCREGDVAYMDVPTIRYRVGSADQLTHNERMVWIARNNLKTIQKMLFIAKNEIILPASMIRRRLAQSHAWVGIAELERHRVSACHHLVRSLCYSPFRIKIIAYLLLSLLPYTVSAQLRKLWTGIMHK
jgi:hypothetical protein